MPAIVVDTSIDANSGFRLNSQVPLSTYKQEGAGNSGGKRVQRNEINVAMTPRVGDVWFDRRRPKTSMTITVVLSDPP